MNEAKTYMEGENTESIASQALGGFAKAVVQCDELSTQLSVRLESFLAEPSPTTADAGITVEQWPPYFNELRAQTDILRRINTRLSDILHRLEV